MTSLYMFDDVNVSLIPRDAKYVAYYLDGIYNTEAAVREQFPHATLVSIAVFPQDDAEMLDVENGDATIADIYAWLNRQLARGVYRPIIYISGGRVDQMMLTMNANGFKRDQYRINSAHYTGTPHICGPDSCGVCQEQCDGTQYTDHADGSSLDESLLSYEVVFTAPEAPKPEPKAEPKPEPKPEPVKDEPKPAPEPVSVPAPEPVTPTDAQEVVTQLEDETKTTITALEDDTKATLEKLESNALKAVKDIEEFISEHAIS